MAGRCSAMVRIEHLVNPMSFGDRLVASRGRPIASRQLTYYAGATCDKNGRHYRLRICVRAWRRSAVKLRSRVG